MPEIKILPLRRDFYYVNENHAIVAGFHVGFADEQKTKSQRRMFLWQRLPCVKGAVSEAD